MDMERNLENELVDSIDATSTDSNNIYENINKLNAKLDELNEFYNPTVVSETESSSFPSLVSDEKLTDESNLEISNEISMPEVKEEEVTNDLDTVKDGKGQYILITILTIILIALLLLMVYFTSSL